MTTAVAYSTLAEDIAIHTTNVNPKVVLWAARNAVMRFTKDIDILQTTDTVTRVLKEPEGKEPFYVWEFIHKGFHFGQIMGLWLGRVDGTEDTSFSHLVEKNVQLLPDEDTFWIPAMMDVGEQEVTCKYSLTVKRDAESFPAVLNEQYNPALVACAMTYLTPHLAVPNENWQMIYRNELIRAGNNLAGPRTEEILPHTGPISTVF